VYISQEVGASEPDVMVGYHPSSVPREDPLPMEEPTGRASAALEVLVSRARRVQSQPLVGLTWRRSVEVTGAVTAFGSLDQPCASAARRAPARRGRWLDDQHSRDPRCASACPGNDPGSGRFAMSVTWRSSGI